MAYRKPHGRRIFLKGLSAAALAAGARPVKAGMPHSGDTFDFVTQPPTTPPHPFSADVRPYATPEKMADKLAFLRSLPKVERKWRATARLFQGFDRRTQLEKVNRFVNRIPYVPDIDGDGQEDYWDDPIHFFGRGGDCEEYAMAKSALLQCLGFHPDRLALVALLRLEDNEGHAVLSVDMDRIYIILDQQYEEPRRESDYGGYRLVYTMSRRGTFVPVTPGGQSRP